MNFQRPIISIIVPVYNVEPYIRRALVSIYEQSYESFEVIVVDDCGIDNSILIAESVSKLYSKCKTIFVRHNYNRGLSAARNSGLNAASGDYVIFVDSDDALVPDALQNFVYQVQKYKYPDVVVGVLRNTKGNIDIEFDDNNDRIYDNSCVYLQGNEIISKKMFDYSQKNNIPPTAPNKLYKLQFLRDNKLSFVEGIIHEDEKFFIDLSCYINTLAIYNGVTYIRYVNKNSITTSLSIKTSMENWIVIVSQSMHTIYHANVSLRISYLLKEIENKYLELPRESMLLALRAKVLLFKLSIKALRAGHYRLALSPCILVIFPFRISHFRKVNVWLRRYYSWANLWQYV